MNRPLACCILGRSTLLWFTTINSYYSKYFFSSMISSIVIIIYYILYLYSANFWNICIEGETIIFVFLLKQIYIHYLFKYGIKLEYRLYKITMGARKRVQPIRTEGHIVKEIKHITNSGKTLCQQDMRWRELHTK